MQRIHMNTNKNSTEEYAYCMDVVIKRQSPRLGLNCILPAPSFVSLLGLSWFGTTSFARRIEDHIFMILSTY